MSLISLVTMLMVIGLLGAWGFTRLLQVQPSEIELGKTEQHIIFKTVDVKKRVDEYTLLVTPEGWQDSGIDIKRGDHLSFISGGKVCIDVEHIVENTENRRKLEDSAAKQHPNLASDENHAPEDYFKKEQLWKLKLERPWTTPDGFDLKTYRPKWPGRAKHYLFPDKGVGGLIAAIHEGGSEPAKCDAFFVGSRHDEPVKDGGVEKDGHLWFTVNDIQFANAVVPELFYNDNIGSFWVRVIVKHK